MDDHDNNNHINDTNSGASTSSSVQRAIPFGDVGNDSNEVVDNHDNNNDDNHDNNPTTVSGNNDIPTDVEAGNNVNSSEQNTVMQPEIIDDDDCPTPFNSALYEVPDVTMRKIHGKKPEIIDDDDDCPVPFNSAIYEDPDVTMRKVKGKKPDIIDSVNDAPLPPSRVAALYEQMVDDNEGTNDEILMKKELEAEMEARIAALYEQMVHDNEVEQTNQAHHNGGERQSTQQQSQRSAPTSSSSSSGHQQQSPPIIRRPPPPSMLVDPHGGDDEGGASTNSAAVPQTDESAPSTLMVEVEATLVQDAFVTHAPPVQVYDATPIQDEEEVGDEEETSWWKRNPKFLGLVLVLIVGLAVMAALLASRNNGGDSSNGGDGIESILGNNATAEVSGIFSPMWFLIKLILLPYCFK